MVARSTFVHLCQVKQLVPYILPHDLATVRHAMVTSMLDCCNLLYKVSLTLTQKMQLV